MTVRAFCANAEEALAGLDAADVDGAVLDRIVIVVTMAGKDVARIRAALTVLADVGNAEIRNELMPLLSALDTIHY